MTTHRQICLLGPFLAMLHGESVTQFGSDTARALLAYLALHPGTPHRRDALAGLLWPEHSDAEARRNLRVALSRLRAAIGDRDQDAPLLQVERQTILLHETRCFVDVGAMRGALAETRAHAHERLERCGECARRLQEAVDLYRGEFLVGFSLDSVPFEEWMVVEREALHWQALEALAALTEYHESHGNYEAAIENARRQVELEPWREAAHQQWMRCLALSGRRGAALAQYEACRQILAEELGVEPEPETQALLQRIRSGELAPPPAAAGPPAVAAPPAATRRSVPAPVAPPVRVAPPPTTPVPAQPDGERRIVTVLSVGFVGETAAEEDLDPELWGEEVGVAMSHALAVVDRYGGELSQAREDGLVALFGAAVAHEDDPERAVLAALAIGQALQGEGELQAQVGVHTGPAVVPRIGDGQQRHAATALGNVVPLAGQIERAAQPGSVLVDEQTYRLAHPFFEWEAAGEIATGRATSRVYRPLARTVQEDVLRGKGRGIAGLESPLVGRDAEVHALRQALDDLQQGIGGIVTVIGDAGIGKSRLVAEIRKAVPWTPSGQALSAGEGSANPRWLEGRCLSYTEAEAYRLWSDVLRGLLDVAPDAAAVTVRDTLRERVQALCGEGAGEVYPFLAHLMSLPLEEEDAARLHGLDGMSVRILTFRAWELLLDRTAQQHALVLVCEDLHWADSTSLALLEHLLPLAERVPLLYICVFRPLTEHGCWQVRERAAREFRHLHTDLLLEALVESESAELIGNLLRIEDLPRVLRARILDHAEGNPFYVEEILRSLIDGGALVYDETTGHWRAVDDTGGDLADLPLPDTLRGVLMARIDRLPLAARRVLCLASVVGRIFERRVLEGLIPNASALDGDLRTLLRAQMIRLHAQRASFAQGAPDSQRPEPTYIFKHQLTQEAAYESLLRRKRRELHRRVAQALEQLYPERVEKQLGLLAHHWERAGDVEQAVGYLRRAGKQAAAQFANGEAVAYLRRALDLTPQEDQQGCYALLMLREQVHNVQGDREGQDRDLAALEALAGQLGERQQAEVAVRRAHHAVMTVDYATAVAAAQTASRLGQATGDVLSQAAGHRHWGRTLRRQGWLAEAQSQLERALALARSAGLRREQAYDLRQLGCVCFELHDYAESSAYHEQALCLFREIGDRRGEGMSLRDLAWALLPLGELAQARHYMEQSLQVCRETGDRRDEGWALFGLGHWAVHHRDWADAVVYYERSLLLMREADPMGEASACMYSGLVYYTLGAYGRARDALERALQVGRELPPDDEAALMAGVAMASYQQGNRQEAGVYVQRVRHLFHDREARLSLSLVVLGHVEFYLGRVAEAADAYHQAEMALGVAVTANWRAELNAGHARIHLAQGELPAALACVEEVLGLIEAHPTLPFAMEPFRIYLTCYQILLANDDPRAGPLLCAAHRLLQEQAAKTDDPGLRRSLLENVSAHREIAALYAQQH